MVTGVPGPPGPSAPRHVDLATEERLEDVTTQLRLMGDKTVLDQAAHMNDVTLNHALDQVFFSLDLT